MKTCSRGQRHLAGLASPTKRQTIPLWIAAPSCWIQRSWKKRVSRPAALWPAWRKLPQNSLRKPSKRISWQSAVRLDLDSSAVGKHLGDALHYFGSVIAETHHRVSAGLRRMHQQQFVGLDTRLLAQLGEDSDIAAN